MIDSDAEIKDMYQNGDYVGMMNTIDTRWGLQMRRTIPERMHHGIVAWIFFGIRPGDFLNAVIDHELFEAFGRADEENTALIHEYVKFFYQYTPSQCHGLERAKRWKGIFPAEAPTE
jgi:hypothetical protein